VVHLLAAENEEQELDVGVGEDYGFGAGQVASLFLQPVDRRWEQNLNNRNHRIGQLQNIIMRPKINSQLHNSRPGELQLRIKMLLPEHRLQIPKPKPNPLRNRLRRIATEKHTLLRNLRQHVQRRMRQILNLVDHEVVDGGSGVASEPHLGEDVVDDVHHVVGAELGLPALVLAEGLVDLLFLG
jgi:hypothetical protein